jgi:outer membrane protein TolC
LQARPERKATAAKGNALSREIEQAEKQRWPKLDFSSNYGALGQGPDRALSTWQVGGSLSVPIWTGGRIENDIKAARFRRDQWKQEDRQLSQQIEQEITQALIEGRASSEQVQHLEAAAAAARQTLELARLRYEGGLTSNLDVVTAQGELAQSEEESIRARYAGRLAEAKLARARGDVRMFAEGR